MLSSRCDKQYGQVSVRIQGLGVLAARQRITTGGGMGAFEQSW